MRAGYIVRSLGEVVVGGERGMRKVVAVVEGWSGAAGERERAASAGSGGLLQRSAQWTVMLVETWSLNPIRVRVRVRVRSPLGA